jgi:hypothetical protein
VDKNGNHAYDPGEGYNGALIRGIRNTGTPEAFWTRDLKGFMDHFDGYYDAVLWYWSTRNGAIYFTQVALDEEYTPGYTSVSPIIVYIDDATRDWRVDWEITPVISPTVTPTVPPPDSNGNIFVTQTQYSPVLGGLSGADSKCQQSAEDAGLGGFWKSWISSDTVSAASRL